MAPRQMTRRKDEQSRRAREPRISASRVEPDVEPLDNEQTVPVNGHQELDCATTVTRTRGSMRCQRSPVFCRPTTHASMKHEGQVGYACNTRGVGWMVSSLRGVHTDTMKHGRPIARLGKTCGKRRACNVAGASADWFTQGKHEGCQYPLVHPKRQSDMWGNV